MPSQSISSTRNKWILDRTCSYRRQLYNGVDITLSLGGYAAVLQQPVILSIRGIVETPDSALRNRGLAPGSPQTSNARHLRLRGATGSRGHAGYSVAAWRPSQRR